MGFDTGLTVFLTGVGIAATAALGMMALKPKQMAIGHAFLGVSAVLIVVGLWGMLRGSGDTGTPAAITQDHPVNSPINPQTSQTMTNSPEGVQIMGDNVTVNKGPKARKLTPVQEERFVQVLKDKPKGHVAVTCIESGGPEPCNFARQLVRLLESQGAGWTVTFSPIMSGGGDPTKTIPPLYLEAQSEMPPPFAFALREALKAADHEPVCLTKADQPPDFLQLTVWHNSE